MACDSRLLTLKVYKFTLRIVDAQYVAIPQPCRHLSVQFQFGNLCLWSLVEPEGAKVAKCIRIFGTGNLVTEIGGMQYIGTVQEHGGNLIWHVWIEP